MKRNKCLLELKELFGDENMYNYLKFIDLNYDLSQEEIIAKYKFIKSEEESKIKKIDIIKRNKCILKMKEYFGDANMYNYLKFFDEHYDLSEEEIIAKYIENYHQFVEKKEVKM